MEVRVTRHLNSLSPMVYTQDEKSTSGVVVLFSYISPYIGAFLTIQYAMLAGYLPFDDDPANPEGDNINLLYKYITQTPLTFPEYVSAMARDLLRQILSIPFLLEISR